MKSPNTFNIIVPQKYNYEPIVSDVIFMRDHFLDDDLDYDKSKEELLKMHIGRNVLHENCFESQNKIWMYEGYLYFNDNHNNIYMPNIYDCIVNYYNDDVPTLKRKYKFVTFNNKPRFHRIITSSWVNENFKPYEYFYTAGFNVEQDKITAHLLILEELYPGLPRKLIGPDPHIWDDGTAFKKYFYPYSSDAVFNIVNEVSFWELGCSLSEKTLWSFLSYNIPIVSGYAMAESLERIGFDMFTDIVNYSSQFIENPFDRTLKLLNDNKEILNNAHDILTVEILDRLKYNKSILLQKDLLKKAVYNLNSNEMLAKYEEICYNNPIINHFYVKKTN